MYRPIGTEANDVIPIRHIATNSYLDLVRYLVDHFNLERTGDTIYITY